MDELEVVVDDSAEFVTVLQTCLDCSRPFETRYANIVIIEVCRICEDCRKVAAESYARGVIDGTRHSPPRFAIVQL